jgi:hypothetical protein
MVKVLTELAPGEVRVHPLYASPTIVRGGELATASEAIANPDTPVPPPLAATGVDVDLPAAS